MTRLFFYLVLLAAAAAAQSRPFDAASADRFAKLALACVHKEFPNKISHTLNSDADVAAPRNLTPAFYGCYDWHSSVHGHWLLARLVRVHPEAPFAAEARAALRASITPEHIAEEVKYLNAEGRASFERPYGLAWLLQLAAELREAENPEPQRTQRSPEESEGNQARALQPQGSRSRAKEDEGKRGNAATAGGVESEASETETNEPKAKREAARRYEQLAELAQVLKPLEMAAVARLKTWLPKLSHPVRSGEHSQTAFALGLMLDYAHAAGDPEFAKLLEGKARSFYGGDRDCPLGYEPSGEDFLSPCLAEADVMRRVLPREEFAGWLRGFLPVLYQPVAKTGVIPRPWLEPAVVTDPSDPKLAHLDGLNLSRAWMLEGIAAALDTSGLRPLEQARVGARDAMARGKLLGAAKAHREAGLASVTGEHYEGGHWLGSFAVYLVTERGR